MKQGGNLLLEVRVLDDGLVQARRKDHRRLGDQDRRDAIEIADSLPGITVADVLREFPGAKVVSKQTERA